MGHVHGIDTWGMYMVSTWALQKSEVGGGDCQWDMIVAHLMDLALVMCLYKPFDILVKEWPLELFQKLHPHGVNLLVT
jgi:hypothetical protein